MEIVFTYQYNPGHTLAIAFEHETAIAFLDEQEISHDFSGLGEGQLVTDLPHPFLRAARVEGVVWVEAIAPYTDSYEPESQTFPLVIPQPTLEEAQAQAYRRIERLRIAHEGLGLPWAGDRLQTDARSRENLSAMAGAIANGIAPNPIYWRMESNAIAPFSHAEFLQMAGAVLLWGQQCYTAAWTHKDAIAQMTSVAEIQAHNLEEGWPDASN